MKGRKGSLLTVFFIFFIDNFGYALVFPLFAPLLLNPAYGMLPERMAIEDKNVLLGILIAAYPFAQFFGAPFFGSVADYIGRKKSFYFTMGGIVVGYCLSAFAIIGHSYIFLFFSRLFTGFFAGNWSLVFASIADLSENEKERARNFGWNAALAGISWVLSMLVGGDLSNPQLLRISSPAFPLWITALFSMIGIFFLVFFFNEPPENTRKKLHFTFLKGFQDLTLAFRLKGLRSHYIVLLFYSLGWMMTIAWLNPTILERFGKSQVTSTSVLMAVGVVWGLSSSLLNPPLIAKMRLGILVVVSLFLLSFFLFGASVTNLFLLFVVFYLLGTVFAPLFWSNLLNLISCASEKRIQGITMGIGQSVMSLAQILAPILAGGISAYSLSGVFYTASTIVFLGFLLLITLHKSECGG